MEVRESSLCHWLGTQPGQKARVQQHGSQKKHEELWNSWGDSLAAMESETEVWIIFTTSSSISGTLSQWLQYKMVKEVQNMRAQRLSPEAIRYLTPEAHLDSPENSWSLYLFVSKNCCVLSLSQMNQVASKYVYPSAPGAMSNRWI